MTQLERNFVFAYMPKWKSSEKLISSGNYGFGSALDPVFSTKEKQEKSYLVFKPTDDDSVNGDWRGGAETTDNCASVRCNYKMQRTTQKCNLR